MSQSQFYLTHLYPKEMSIYGDMGNIIALKYHLKQRGFEIVYQTVDQGQDLPMQNDFYFMGGGQDKEQEVIFRDMSDKRERLFSDFERGVPMLAICGAYQLLGQKFLTGEGVEIDGLGWFEVETKALDTSVGSRCIGNIVEESLLPELLGEKFIGFENHSGQTYFTSQNESKPLAKVLVGFGNNSVEKIEGCVRKNTIGTYMHGSCLPKNPKLADYLIDKALEVKFIGFPKIEDKHHDSSLVKTDENIVQAVRSQLLKRFKVI